MAQNYQLQKTGQEIDALLQKIDGLDVATDESSGLMSAQDKSKLDGIESGAEENLIEAIVLGDQSLSPSGSKTVTIPMDDVPAMGSNNPVKSGGVYTALAGINEKIPSEASASNKLADKGYVDESISTSSATYISNNGQPFASLADLQAYTGAHDKNDYAYVVGTDAAGNTVYNRYKFDGTNWAFEYAINNTAFTTSQWNTINSGMVAADKTKLDALPNNETLQEDLDEKAKKVSGATAGNLAALDESGNLKDAGIAADNVAQKGEIQTYSGNLVDTRSAGTAQEFTYRKSGGDGVNWMRRIKGKSLVWNQNEKVLNLDNWNVEDGVTASFSNGIATVDFPGNNKGLAGRNPHHFSIILGHKYYMSINAYLSGAGTFFFSFGGVTDVLLRKDFTESGRQRLTGIRTATASSSNAGYIYTSTEISGCTVDSPMLIDLTLLFGEGNEPSTVEEFEALYNEPYYPYQPGIIKNNDAVAIETVGFNQWDEEWELGTWDANGQKVTNARSIRSKNYISVLPNTAYYLFDNAAVYTRGLVVRYLDGAKKYISTSVVQNTGFTTLANAAYIVICTFVDDDVTTYQNNICINLSDPAKNGTYEPYWKKSIQLGLNAFRVTDGTNIITVNGLKSAGSVYDEIDQVRKKYIKRLGEVDLGTLIWTYKTSGSGTGSGAYPYFHAQIPSAAVSFNPICGKYSTIDNNSTAFGNGPDKAVSGRDITGSSTVNIRDLAYTDAATFKTAVTGVMLQFALATPVEYDLVDDIPNAIEVDENGTERAIFPEADDPSAPFAADSNYSVSTANLVRKLNDAS